MRRTQRGRYCLQLLACLALAGGWAFGGQARADEGKAEGDKPLATAKHETGLVVEVVEIKRTEHEQLQIRWRYRNPTDKPIELLAKSPPSGPGPKMKFVKAIYYEVGKLESGKAYRVPIVTTKDGKWILKSLPLEAIVVGPNKEWEFWATFYLPRGDDDKITLHVPGTLPIEGLTVPKAPKK